jgi:hypothetical protein
MQTLKNTVYSGNTETGIISERKDTFPKAVTIGLGAAMLFAPLATTNVDIGINSNNAVVSYASSTYNVRTTVYTNKISEETEAIQSMTKERRKTVKVHLNNSGYKKHTLNFPEDDLFDDGQFEEFELTSQTKTIPVKAVISHSGYLKHKLVFEDEANV